MFTWQECLVCVVITWIVSYFYHRRNWLRNLEQDQKWIAEIVKEHYQKALVKNRKIYEDSVASQNLVITKDGIEEVNE